MSQTPPARFSAAQLKAALPLLAILLAILAAWIGWNGWRQWQGERATQATGAARDASVQIVQRTVDSARTRLLAQLATADAKRALATGNLDALPALVKQGWLEAEHVEVVDASLDAAYAGLPASGFGRIAVAEAALASGKPAARLVRDASAPRLLVAAPVQAADARAVVVVRTSTKPLEAALRAVNVENNNYLALRQGDFALVERGDASLAESADVLARNVPDTSLRVVAAVPERDPPPFGLGALAALVLAAVLAALAVACALANRRGRTGAKDEDTLTLAQAVQADPAPEVIAPRVLQENDVQSPEQKSAGVAIDSSIFRAYDIRGVMGQTLDAGVAEYIGQAVGSLMHEKELTDIVVGRDGRLSGPELVEGLISGLRKAGRNVIDIGLAPTPLVYFGSYFLRTGCCIAVTGSHNPPDYNGFKIVVGGETLSGDTITDLYDRIASGRLHASTDQPGTSTSRRIDDDYVERIANDVQLQRPLKVVVDAGNGVAGELGPRVLEAIGAQVVPLFCEIDGNFPNHHPDPSEPDNLKDLIAAVQREGADLGVAFDGDGDRLGVVTPEGDNIFPDRLLMLFAADVLERNPGAVVLYDVKCTGHLAGHILRHGGSPLMWKTGHSLIKAKMRETGAALAGEMSGHFFFAERWFGFDDGIYSAARLLEILAYRDETPGDVLRALPGGVSTPEIKIDAPAGDPHAFVAGFREQAHFEGGRVSTIDGVRVDWNDGWGLVRASNTTPVLVLRFDADSEDALQRIQTTFREQLLAFKPDLVVPF